MLAVYRTDTRNLLQVPAAPESLYPTVTLDSWINRSRGQLAGEAECIRVIGTIATVVGQRAYNFSGINLGTSSVTGVQGAINIRRMSIAIGDGQKWLTPRGWEWFDLYHLNNVVPINGVPRVWSQYGQGAANAGTGSNSSGSFYIDPPPDQVYTLNCDCTCYPIALVDDTTKESIPYLWTDAVPFLATYFALLSAQMNSRQGDAERMFKHYETFVDRARKASNPSVDRWLYQQAGDPVQAAKLGLQKPAMGG